MGDMDDARGLIGTTEAARLWAVTRQTATSWFKAGKVAGARQVDDEWRATEGEVRRAKVLAASSLFALGVAESELAEFQRGHGVRSTDGRFSLDDLDAMRGKSRRTLPPSRTLSAAERLQLHIDLRLRGVAPHDFPDEAWPMHVCPPFVGPPNLFAYGLGAYLPDEARPMAVRITRSAGLIVNAEGARLVAATPAHELVPRPLRELPPEMARDTQLWHEEAAAWQDAWQASVARRSDK